MALATVPELALGAALLLGALPTQAMPLLGPDANDACGRVLASNGAVTPDQNEVSRNCLGILAGSDGLGGGLDVVTTPGAGTEIVFLPFVPVDVGLQVPEPGTLLLVAIGLLGAVGVSRRRWLVGKFSAWAQARRSTGNQLPNGGSDPVSDFPSRADLARQPVEAPPGHHT